MSLLTHYSKMCNSKTWLPEYDIEVIIWYRSNIVIRANHGKRRPQVRSKQLNKAPPLAIFHETYNGCRAIAVVNNDLCSSCPPIRRNVGSPTFDLSRNRIIVFLFFLSLFFLMPTNPSIQAATEMWGISRHRCSD